MKKTILLLGGSGTLSKGVLKQALKCGYIVSIMNRGNNNHLLPDGVSEVIICDFNDTNRLISCFYNKSYDVIIDFISRTSNDIKRIFPIFKNKCQQYIFISSACVFCREKMPIIESSDKPNTKWKYNIEKHECEETLKLLSQNSDCNYTIIRPYITYDGERIPFGITPQYKYHRTIIERIKSGKPWFVWNEGSNYTTITHVDDFSKGVVGLCQNEKAINRDFNVVSRFSYRHIDVVKELFKQLGIEPKIESFTDKEIYDVIPEVKEVLLGDRSDNAIFDNTAIITAVNDMNFSINLTEGIKRNLTYYSQLKCFNYDYRFDALIDRLLYKKGICCNFIAYPNSATKHAKLTYMLFRYLPIKIANRIYKYI